MNHYGKVYTFFSLVASKPGFFGPAQDFYAAPQLHPDGSQLAYICWSQGIKKGFGG